MEMTINMAYVHGYWHNLIDTILVWFVGMGADMTYDYDSWPCVQIYTKGWFIVRVCWYSLLSQVIDMAF